MQRPSAHTTIAPDPSIDPTAASDLKSSRTSPSMPANIPTTVPTAPTPSIVFLANAARLPENHLRRRGPHRDHEHSRILNVAADADKFQAAYAPFSSTRMERY